MLKTGGAVLQISIHAPRTGSDKRGIQLHMACVISIHAPRTGSDEGEREYKKALSISIHAPRTGSDHSQLCGRKPAEYFNPRSPHGERRDIYAYNCAGKNFNPRSPHGERHSDMDMDMPTGIISIHAPRTGSDSKK